MKNIFVIGVIVLLFQQILLAQIPETVSFQGVLTNAGGVAITDGDYVLKLKIYDALSGGTLLWEENQTVSTIDGIFNTVLGSANPLSIDFNDPYWLGITIGSGIELSPRIGLTSSFYSLNTRSIPDNIVSTSKLQTNSVNSEKIEDNTILAADINPNLISSLNGVQNDGGNIDFIAGSNITIVPDDAAKTITISSGGSGGGGGTLDDAYDYGGAGAGRVINADAGPVQISGTDGLQINEEVAVYSGGTIRAGLRNSSSNSGQAVVYQTDGDMAVSMSTSGLGARGGFYLYDANELVKLKLFANDNEDGVIESNFIHMSGSKIDDAVTRNNAVGYFINDAEDPNIIVQGNAVGIYSEAEIAGLFKGKHHFGIYSSNDDIIGHYYYGDDKFVGVYGKSSGEMGTQGVYGLGIDGYVNYGVYGRAQSNKDNYGVYGVAVGLQNSGKNIGVYGYSYSGSSNLAGYFDGDVDISGTLTKSSGAFKIDHPLDPANKYLYHSFVESPEMMNIYNGNITLDGNGEAWITLPEWFEALNKDFRYQLTCIGGYSQVFIAEEISGNQFKIGGGSPGLKISWMVTGVRNDAYARKNRIPVEATKSDRDRGKYINPAAFGLNETNDINYEQIKKIKEESESENKSGK